MEKLMARIEGLETQVLSLKNIIALQTHAKPAYFFRAWYLVFAVMLAAIITGLAVLITLIIPLSRDVSYIAQVLEVSEVIIE